MMSDRTDSGISVDDLAEDFARRWRAGESPTVGEYAAKYPQLAEQIHDLFPAVLMMERLKPQRPGALASAPSNPIRPMDEFGDYRIVRELGRGGMGVVYEAEQKSLGRRVALKVLPAQLLANERLRSRFHRESQAAARLHHTNIVPVFGIGESEGHCFYAMQLIEGRGLDQVIRDTSSDVGDEDSSTDGDRTVLWQQGDRGATTEQDAAEAAAPSVAETPHPATHRKSGLTDLSTSELARTVARLAVQVADALSYAHQNGVLHRDIKPSNLLLDERGVVWVTDFGVAKLLEEANLTQSGDLVGTLRYMPPERFSGVSDARGDVYSLGVTIFELLTMRPAFPETSPQHLIQLITHSDLPRLRKFKPGLPTDLETIVAKATARDPELRYQSAEELAADLRRFLDDQPIRARQAGPLERAARWCRRNRAVAALTALAFALMIVVTVVSVSASITTAAANRETADANREMQKALVAEQTERRNVEAVSALALDALHRMYDGFAPNRLIVTPNAATSSDGSTESTNFQIQPVLPPEAVPLLEELLRTYEKIAASSRDFPALRVQAAEANQRIADIHKRLGRNDDAIAAYNTAIEIYNEMPSTGPAESSRIKLARCYNELGRVYRGMSRPDDARAMHANAMQTLTSTSTAFAARPECRYELANTYYAMGQRDMLVMPRGPGPGPGPAQGLVVGGGPDSRREGRMPNGRRERPAKKGARPSSGPSRTESSDGRAMLRPFGNRQSNPIQKAIEILEPLVQQFDAVPEYRHLLANCYRDLPPEPGGGPPFSRSTGNQRAVALLRRLLKDSPKSPDYRFDLCETLGQMMPPPRSISAEEVAAQKQRLEEAISLSAELVRQYPDLPNYAFANAQYLDRLGMFLVRAGSVEEGLKMSRKAVEQQTALLGEHPQVAAYGFWLGMMEATLGRGLTEAGKFKEAQAQLRQAIERLEATIAAAPQLSSLQRFIGMTYRDLAIAYRRTGDNDDAKRAQAKAELLSMNIGPPMGLPSPDLDRKAEPLK